MIAQQQKQIDALTAALQKVSAQLELGKSAPQTDVKCHTADYRELLSGRADPPARFPSHRIPIR